MAYPKGPPGQPGGPKAEELRPREHSDFWVLQRAASAVGGRARRVREVHCGPGPRRAVAEGRSCAGERGSRPRLLQPSALDGVDVGIGIGICGAGCVEMAAPVPRGQPFPLRGGRDRIRTGVTRVAVEPLNHSGTRPCVSRRGSTVGPGVLVAQGRGAGRNATAIPRSRSAPWSYDQRRTGEPSRDRVHMRSCPLLLGS